MSVLFFESQSALSEKSIPTECPGCKPGSHKKHFDDCPSRVRKRKSDEMEVGAEPEPLMAVPFVDIGVNEISDHFASVTKYLRQPYEKRPLSNLDGV